MGPLTLFQKGGGYLSEYQWPITPPTANPAHTAVTRNIRGATI